MTSAKVLVPAIYFLLAIGSLANADTITDLTNRAKAQGIGTINVPTPQGFPLAIGSFEAAYYEHAVFLVQIESKSSSLSRSAENVWTWYLAKILANVSSAVLPPVTLPENIAGPSDHIGENQIFIRTPGGDIVVSGVTFHSEEAPPVLEVGKQYLVFLAFLRYSPKGFTRIAEMVMGPSSAFLYNPADDLLTPIAPADTLTNPVVSEIQVQGSLTRLGAYLSTIAPSKFSDQNTAK